MWGLAAVVCPAGVLWRWTGVVTSRSRYPTDLSDAQWSSIEPVLAAWRARRLAASACGDACVVHDLREIVNAILYVVRAGCSWPLLPHDLPPYKTVWGSETPFPCELVNCRPWSSG